MKLLLVDKEFRIDSLSLRNGIYAKGNEVFLSGMLRMTMVLFQSERGVRKSLFVAMRLSRSNKGIERRHNMELRHLTFCSGTNADNYQL
jgi:hypothetical protein